MVVEELSIITWIPRTTIHLYEVRAFLSGDFNELPLLSKHDLANYLQRLDVDSSSTSFTEGLETLRKLD